MTPRAAAGLAGVCIGLVALAAWLRPPLPVDDPVWHDRYDHHLRKHAKRNFGAGFDWRWFRAQAIAESGLRAHAQSHRGARGIMQIMPATYAEIWQESRLVPDILDARWNIASGLYYSGNLFYRWREKTPSAERLWFTLASYNAGFTGILRARKRTRAAGRDPTLWSDVAPYAPRETRQYLERIRALMGA